MLSTEDERKIAELGISLDLISIQIEKFNQGFDFIKLENPAIVENGILKLSGEEENEFERYYEAYDGSVTKFVPASGAASRMFKHLFEFLQSYDGEASHEKLTNEGGLVFDFFKQLESFAFYEDLKENFLNTHELSIHEAHLKRAYDKILESLLLETGLNYGNLPKGLLKFHRLNAETITPVQEHVQEGLAYATKKNNLALHFTVSPEHLSLFERHLKNVSEGLAEDVNVAVSFSTQKHSTDTIAVDSDNRPFRDEQGNSIFRPSGHGALLENLNDLDKDVVFVKNIDNVIPGRLQGETIRFKKILAGVLLSFQGKIFDLLKKNEEGEDIEDQGRVLLRELGQIGEFTNGEMIDKLNRPIRVCGMVVNQGEPGGGPFWVQGEAGKQSLQIVEKAQVDLENESQRRIFEGSTHFNPVDIVCGMRDFKGKKFDLLKFRDPETGFITEKSYNGKTLKAMELPGLWNGSMANWNTIFVEVPLITFNPVKTVNDLLKQEHQ